MSQTDSAARASLFSTIAVKFSLLAKREKSLIFFSAPLLVLIVAALLVLEPLYIDITKIHERGLAKERSLVALQETKNALISEAGKDPDERIKLQIAGLQKQLNATLASFDSELGHLVSPQAMPVLLDNLFKEAKGLNLIEMRSMAPTRVYTDQSDEAGLQLFRQGIHITFEGDYFATRDFFAKAEEMDWELYWKFLDYEVHAHPLATIQLEVFTLSTSEAFIGVN